MYTYNIKKIDRVVDGDTVYLTVDLGFYVDYRVRLRVEGIDAPEVRGSEKIEGLKVKEYAIGILANQETLILRTTGKPDKYGRWLGDIFIGEGQESFARLVEEFYTKMGVLK